MPKSSSNSIQWKPDENLVQEAYKEIINLFVDNNTPNNNDETFLQACAKIGAFLQDEDQVMERLQELNQTLEKLIPNEKITNETLLDKDKRKQVGILRRFLENELHQAGFESVFAKSFKVISPVTFRQTLINGLIIKDAVLGADKHGEFTHALQWVLIIHQQNKTNFLGNGITVIDIFKKLGEENSVYEKTYSNEKSIWDVIVDRWSNHQSDCRYPEYLNELIKNSDENLSLLRLLLKSRATKRHTCGTFFEPNQKQDTKKYEKNDRAGIWVPNESKFKK